MPTSGCLTEEGRNLEEGGQRLLNEGAAAPARVLRVNASGWSEPASPRWQCGPAGFTLLAGVAPAQAIPVRVPVWCSPGHRACPERSEGAPGLTYPSRAQSLDRL